MVRQMMEVLFVLSVFTLPTVAILSAGYGLAVRWMRSKAGKEFAAGAARAPNRDLTATT
jgi:hypothetical protein